MWGCSYTVFIIDSKLRLVSTNWKPSGKDRSSEIPPGTWTLSESRSCLVLKKGLAINCILNASWCGNSCEIPARLQTLFESESACLYVDRDIRHILIVEQGGLGCLQRMKSNSFLLSRASIVGKQYEHSSSIGYFLRENLW